MLPYYLKVLLKGGLFILKKSTILGILSFIFNTCFSIALFALTAYLIYTFSIDGFNFGKKIMSKDKIESPATEVVVKIEDGASIAEVSKILEKEGLIKNAYLYQLEAFLKGINDDYIGGEFTLNTNMDSNELNQALRTVKVYSQDIKITIKEGFSVQDIAVYLEANNVVSAEEFLKACKDGDFSFEFLSYAEEGEEVEQSQNRLEGFLFPDTYLIAPNSSPEQIIYKMLKRFNEMYNVKLLERTEELGLTVNEVVNIASIIEKEVKLKSERAKASAVIHNRLREKMNLQMCSTILYVLDKKKVFLLDNDLKVKSPYNTYINPGLPIRPICNPGIECIKAALYPENADYLYFVVKDEETGEHVFTSNYDEFLKAKDEYKQKY